MSLVVEDGSIVSGANTYVSLNAYKSFANLRGLTVGTDAAITQAIFRVNVDNCEKGTIYPKTLDLFELDDK